MKSTLYAAALLVVISTQANAVCYTVNCRCYFSPQIMQRVCYDSTYQFPKKRWGEAAPLRSWAHKSGNRRFWDWPEHYVPPRFR